MRHGFSREAGSWHDSRANVRGQEQPTSTADLDFRPSWFEETAPIVLGSALIPEERDSGKRARGEDS